MTPRSTHARNGSRPAVGLKPDVTGLRIVQICPTRDSPCGVGNFSRNLEHILRCQGIAIRTAGQLPSGNADVLLVQHEFALYDSVGLERSLAAWPGVKVLFAHSRGTESFADRVDGFVTLCEGMSQAPRPTLVLRHPGWQTLPLLDRDQLKRELGWSGYRCVVGTNGFISPARQFDGVLESFMDFALNENVLVHVLCPRHASHDNRPGYGDQERRLIRLAERYPRNLLLDATFLDQDALNRRMQACDLLWCWTATGSQPYGSGTCADQYGSGTRLVAASKRQHYHVLDLPNVVAAPPGLREFVDVMKREVLAGNFQRHDPSPLSWNQFAGQLIGFLASLSAGRRGSGSWISASPARACESGGTESLASAAPAAAGAGFVAHQAAGAATEFIDRIASYPPRFKGRGIAISAGGIESSTCAWVLVNLLRWLECPLPIEVWCYDDERDAVWERLVQPLDVRVASVPRPPGIVPAAWAGRRLKPRALLESSFREVLLLDADNLPAWDPAYLFDDPEYRAAGCVFWPANRRAFAESRHLELFGVAYHNEPEQDSALALIDKSIGWKALNLCDWFNQHGDFFYAYTRGDGDTYRLAYQRLNIPYVMTRHAAKEIAGVCIQADPSGRDLFHHRCKSRWSLNGSECIPGFPHEAICQGFVHDLTQRWSPLSHLMRHASQADRSHAAVLHGKPFQCVVGEHSADKLKLMSTGFVEGGRPGDVETWWVSGGHLHLGTRQAAPLYRLAPLASGAWMDLGACGARSQFKLVPK